MMVLRTQKVRLYPNKTMQKVLDDLCDYRRYCWNAGLALWNELYEESLILDDKRLRPNEYKVRNELVANKADWQYRFSARCLQLAISDLNKAWKNFLIRHKLIGANHVLNQRKPLDKVLKLTVLRLLKVSCAWISHTGLSIGMTFA